MIKTALFLSLGLIGHVLAGPLHLDLEMSSAEYRELLKTTLSPQKSIPQEDPAITNAIKLGDRLSKWIAFINAGRASESAIRLTSAATRRGIPIDKPNTYSPSIIKKDTEKVLSELPKQMLEVLTTTEEFPSSLSLDDETFITFARSVDRNYQSAARYKTVDRYRSYYTSAAAEDVRGYFYFLSNKVTANELRETSIIPAEQVSAIKDALAVICLNSVRAMAPCKTEVEQAFKNNELSELYNKYIGQAKKNWSDFFEIPQSARRTDISWSESQTTIPFNTPEIAAFIPYLKENIEDEFRWEGWSLKITFGTFADGPYLKFETGVVPHVNALGGNEIVMDSNQPIEEYESKWTIRHEFGHVLGLPDCYHEFYDSSIDAYVNYQLDITDLMCSRAGNMKERIFTELKEAYSI